MRWRAGSKEAHDAKVEANFRAAAQRTGFDPNRVIVSFSGLLRAFQYAGDTGVLTVNSLAGVSRTSAVSFQVDYPYQEIFLPIRTHQISKPDNVIETEELSIGLLNVKNTGPLWNRSQTLRLNDWRGDGSASGTDSLRYLIVGRFAAPFVMQGERHLARTTTDSIDRRHRGTAMMLDLNCIALYSEATEQILYEQSF